MDSQTGQQENEPDPVEGKSDDMPQDVFGKPAFESKINSKK